MYVGGEVNRMSAKIQIRDGNYQISIPVKEAFEDDNFRRFLEFQRAEEIVSRSKATNEQIAALADEVDQNYWKRNKSRFLRGLSD